MCTYAHATRILTLADTHGYADTHTTTPGSQSSIPALAYGTRESARAPEGRRGGGREDDLGRRCTGTCCRPPPAPPAPAARACTCSA
eukprot:2306886-Rhodomonas_salina.2